MAFNQSNSNNSNGSNRKEAASFINIEIPTADGNKKIGFIALDTDNANQKAIHDHLVANPGAVQELAKNLILTWRENKPAAKTVDTAQLFS